MSWFLHVRLGYKVDAEKLSIIRYGCFYAFPAAKIRLYISSGTFISTEYSNPLTCWMAAYVRGVYIYHRLAVHKT